MIAVVAIKGSACLVIPFGSSLRVQVALSDGRPLRLEIVSKYRMSEDGTPDALLGLWVDARGEAPSLKDAMQEFTRAAGSMAAIVSFATNGPIGNLNPELAYDASPGLKDRAFFQQFLRDTPPLPHPGREVPCEETLALIGALEVHEEKERLVRAVAHYSHALQNWGLGEEIVAFFHLYVAVEALTPILKRRELANRGVTAKELADEWGIELPELDGQVRLRLIFDGDKQAYNDAKTASDAYEHSFWTMDEVRSVATDKRHVVAGCVRRAVIELVDLAEETEQVLLAEPYNKPYGMQFAHYITGRLIGDGDDPSRADEAYPRLRWSIRRKGLTIKEGGPTPASHRFNPVLGDGFSFKPESFQIWGGPPEAKRASAPKVEYGEDNGDLEKADRND
jgi:hypothetical protein